MIDQMTDERLAELRKLRAAFYLTVGTPWDGQEMQESADALAEAVDEIDRLRTENEHLRTPKAAIEILAALENWNSSTAEWAVLNGIAKTLDFLTVNSAQDVIAVLWDILNPVPES